MLFASFRRSVLPVRSDHVHSAESSLDTVESEKDLFQQVVCNQFHELSLANAEFLSISWIRKLLDAFMTCQEEFKIILCNSKEHLSHPPVDKLLSEFLDRSIKALDICNASRDGIERIRQWEKNLEIVVCALDSRSRMLGEAQIRRARKVLTDLALLMLDNKEIGAMSSYRNRSFGRVGKNKDHHNPQSGTSGHSRSLSWSLPESWSATKQIQSIANNLVPPRGNEIVASNGLAVTFYTMSFLLMFVLWTIVIALPCQDHGPQVHFSVPRNFSWSASLSSVHARIMDESRKRERKTGIGLLVEIHQMEKCMHNITDLVEAAQFPLSNEQNEEVKEGVKELSLICEVFKAELEPLDRHLREVFRRIMACRSESLQFAGRE